MIKNKQINEVRYCIQPSAECAGKNNSAWNLDNDSGDLFNRHIAYDVQLIIECQKQRVAHEDWCSFAETNQCFQKLSC
jgi:hypothetical protein